ncbi:hypothetical protein BGZ95_006331 [Linnemannia exigua]|uniref:Glycosyltransferase 61 catalytic domain-containing protein n=1 Tax=Linnemannia exigua TaxID=604196 RepID=A0AAD4DG24_9FUNG|nr:hypothetical protein BGZ95_006331 [Linnemannia exigua]
MYKDWRGATFAREIEIPDATWTCNDQDLTSIEKESKSNKRSRQCIVQNLCVDRQGAFIRSGQQPAVTVPEVNLIASLEGADSYWQPRVELSTNKTMRAHYVDETLFVHGLFWSDHFSHWLYNGMLPLYSTMKRYGGTKASWTFKVNSHYNEYNTKRQGKWEMRHVFQTGFELVLLEDELATEFQTLPPSDAPICFRQAVIGLGSQCALGYCEKNIPSDIYHSFRDVIADYYWKTPDTWQRHIRTSQDLIDAEEQIRLKSEEGGSADTAAEAKTGTQNSTLSCLDKARYYNFEPSSGADPLEPLKESRTRVGYKFPDNVDAEVGHPLYGRRRLVVAMIQREGTRRVINDQELVESLAAAGFRVKWITFDNGCGLPETAYLLRDVHVLISPHGNAIGTSVFMPTTNPVPTMISLDASRYSEAWFINTATAIGQRFIHTICGPHEYVDAGAKTRCPYYKDEALGYKAISIWGRRIVLGLSDELAQTYRERVARGETSDEELQDLRDYVESTPEAQQLAKEEMDYLIGPDVPAALFKKYDTEIVKYFLEVFWRDIARYADVPRVVALVQELQKDQQREQAAAITAAAYGPPTPELEFQQYLNYLRESRACGVKYCKQIIKRNVVTESRAFGIHSIDDPHRWGQSMVDENVFQGLGDVPNWIPESLVPVARK